MFPPNASGTSADLTSRFAGATPTVPCIGSSGRAAAKSLSFAVNRQTPARASSSHIHTRSGSGSWRVAVRWVEVSAPNSGTVVDAPQSRAGVISTKWTASVSPGSAPSTQNGPVCGFRNGNSQTRDTRSSGPRTRPAKQSSVKTSSTEPGTTRAAGATPPNVHAYCSGWNRTTSRPATVSATVPLLRAEDLGHLPDPLRPSYQEPPQDHHAHAHPGRDDRAGVGDRRVQPGHERERRDAGAGEQRRA